MTREDLFCELSDVVFALAPVPDQRHDDITKQTIDDVRRKLVERLDQAEMRVEMDSAFAAEDEADMRLQEEQDEAYPEVGP